MENWTEEEARAYLTQLRWPSGVQCPFCSLHQVTTLRGKRIGFHQCNRCRKQFSVRTATIFERSHVPLAKWVAAFELFCASKKGVSAIRLSRMLAVSYKTAWYMRHRIRYATQRDPPLLFIGRASQDVAA